MLFAEDNSILGCTVLMFKKKKTKHTEAGEVPLWFSALVQDPSSVPSAPDGWLTTSDNYRSRESIWAP